MELEELLNKLIEKGWHPFGRKYNAESGGDFNTISFNYYNDIDEERGIANYSIRELVSKESGLWQFVCKNKLLKEEVSICYEGWANVMAEDGCISKHEIGCREIHTNTERGYRIIESALKDEDELEDFLLSNIKVDG